MKRFSAQYIITASGSILKRGIVTTDEQGLILKIEDTKGKLRESSSIQYFNGIIVPGFVNCHAHLELSDMKGKVEKGGGLGSFITAVRDKRNPDTDKTLEAIRDYDRVMYQTGTSAVADICNSTLTFKTKEKSSIYYINLLEIFGLNPDDIESKLAYILSLRDKASLYSLLSWIVPHSVYSLSSGLFEKISPLIADNDITSIHFLESEQERLLIDQLSGPMLDSFKLIGIDKTILKNRVADHISVIEKYLPSYGSLILVHNTFATETDISRLNRRPETWWCLCPGSNLYIENTLPPLNKLIKHKASIVLGTDSLASNESLNLLEELKILQQNFHSITLNQLIQWACKNGADALRLPHLGTIETGKSPGLVLIEDCDLENIKLTSRSKSRRLI
ncbi:MAG: amidohydrolase family protein [Bacteroidales bacterium]|nr:amidohydrolase family protein [Bacteroidales bacterium]